MTNELIPVEPGSIQKYDDNAFPEITKGNDFLPRLQLMTASSTVCKSGEFPINHYALIENQNMTNLGTEIDVIVGPWRPKALDVSTDKVVAVYDPESAEFKDIQARAPKLNSGCMFGPEFLVYIPSLKKWATLFLSSVSARKEFTAINNHRGSAATLSTRKIETEKYTYFSISTRNCSASLEAPPEEEVLAQAQKFNNPVAVQSQSFEKAEEAPSSRE